MVHGIVPYFPVRVSQLGGRKPAGLARLPLYDAAELNGVEKEIESLFCGAHVEGRRWLWADENSGGKGVDRCWLGEGSATATSMGMGNDDDDETFLGQGRGDGRSQHEVREGGWSE